jgi:hypothetical protein
LTEEKEKRRRKENTIGHNLSRRYDEPKNIHMPIKSSRDEI